MSGSRKRKADEIKTTHSTMVVAVQEPIKRAKQAQEQYQDQDTVDWWNPMDTPGVRKLIAEGSNPIVDKLVAMADRFGKENALSLCHEVQAFYDNEVRPYEPGPDRAWSLESIQRWMAQRAAGLGPSQWSTRTTTPSSTPDVKSNGPELPPRQPIAMALRTDTTDEWDRECEDEQQKHASCSWCRARPPRGDRPTYLVEYGELVPKASKSTVTEGQYDAAQGIVYTFCDVGLHRCMVEHNDHWFPFAKSDVA